jgi:streptogramin lyase
VRLTPIRIGAVAVFGLVAWLAISQSGERIAAAAGDGLRVTHFQLGAAPVAITASHGSVWVVEETGGMRAELVRIDPTTGKRVATILIGRTGPDFGAAAAGGAFVWAAAGNHVIRVDATHANAVKRAVLPGEAATLTLGPGSVWLASIGEQRNMITRLDPATLAVRARIPLTFQPVALAAGLGSVWLASPSGLWRIDPTNDHIVPAPDPVALPASLAVAANRLWVIEQDRRAASIDRAGRVRTQIALPFSPGALAVTPGRIWVTNNCGCRTGKLAVLDTHTRRLLADRTIGETPVDVAPDRGSVWVATFADETVSHVRP